MAWGIYACATSKYDMGYAGCGAAHYWIAGTTAIAVVGALLCTLQPASAQWIQDGAKLSGSGAVGQANQGWSAALSADGSTLAVGGDLDNSQAGAVWVFTRSGNSWSQQGPKLVGSGVTGVLGFSIEQGVSVALSADGNTLIEGGPGDNSGVGAVWVFTRTGGTWSQQGSKLVASDVVGAAQQGISVALSADGNNAAIGGFDDNNFNGAVWIWTRSGNTWSQQGPKLFGSGAVGLPQQGKSVALSADGNTLVVGGAYDHNEIGATWVFTRAAGTWSQQGSKLLASDAVITSFVSQGWSVALSADGNTLATGGPLDNSGAGATWVFTRNGVTWTQQGAKLIGGDGGGLQGHSVSLSADGNTLLEGANGDDDLVGAAWIFTRSGDTWAQQGPKLVGSGYQYYTTAKMIYGVGQGWAAALSADGNTALVSGPSDDQLMGAAWVFVRSLPTNSHDFNGDGYSDILWRDTSGDVAMWQMNGGQVSQSAGLGTVPSGFSIIGQHDFDGDGKADILWRDASGNVSMWFMNGARSPRPRRRQRDQQLDPLRHRRPQRRRQGRFAVARCRHRHRGGLVHERRDRRLDREFRRRRRQLDHRRRRQWRAFCGATAAGDIAFWSVQNGQVTSVRGLGTVTSNFVVQGVGDFNGDGNIDILWRDTNSGALSIWFTNGTQVTSAAAVGTLPSNWNVAQIGDYNGDGKSDILLHRQRRRLGSVADERRDGVVVAAHRQCRHRLGRCRTSTPTE